MRSEWFFAAGARRTPRMEAYLKDLDMVERSHLQYLGIGNAFKLAQPEFADRLVRHCPRVCAYETVLVK